MAWGRASTVATMAELTETLDTTAELLREVTRDPESPGAAAAVERIADDIQRFLNSRGAEALVLMVGAQRVRVPVQLAPSVDRLYGDFRVALSIAFQLYELGRPVAWANALAEAMAWLAGWLNALGVATPPFVLQGLPVPPMVVRAPATTDDDERPRVEVVMQRVRYPQLQPYIASAMQRARASELEPGRWFAELDDDFRGVWADGASKAESLAALADVLHEWLIVKAEHGDDDLLVLDGLDPRALIPAA